MASHRRSFRKAPTLNREDTLVGGRRGEKLTLRPIKGSDILVATSTNSVQITLEANSRCTFCMSDYK